MPIAQAQARILRWSVAFVWLATGVLVVHPHYRSIGAQYLDRAGIQIGLVLTFTAIS